MKEYPTRDIRNVALVGHGAVGKTQLSESLLYSSGTVSRLGKVDDGSTTSDYDPDEVKRKMSINLSLLPFEWRGNKVNLLDTPGYADFVGEVKSGLRAADGAVIVVCAAAGVQVGTEQVWGYADERRLPRLVFINRMDRENADFFQTIAQLQAFYGRRCVPLQAPVGFQSSFQGVVDLLTMKAYLGEKGDEQEIPGDLNPVAQEQREKLMETIAETDDDLMSKYLEGEEIPPHDLEQALCAGVLAGSIVPVLAGSGAKGMGVSRLLDAMSRLLPSPAMSLNQEDGLQADSAGPLAALAFKTSADPYVGRLTYLRMYSGVLASDSHVWNANREKPERIGQLLTLHGKSQEPVARLLAGDIGAVAKLADTHTGDTLCKNEDRRTIPGMAFPSPSYGVAIYPKTKTDVDKLSGALARILEEDPTLRVERNTDTGETILMGLGESHVQVTVEKMGRKFGVGVELMVPKIPYKETITTSRRAEYIHKKQTGGHGQYARVAIELQPLPRGKGFQFEDRIVGGTVPKQYIGSVEKGVQEAMQDGVLAHCPIVDVKVALFDGKDHPVDSSDMAFKIAATMALKKGAQEAHPVLLEPIMILSVSVPDAYTGDIIGDLNGRRAKVLGMTPSDGGRTLVEALAPLAEVQRYATDLRSLTHGRGAFELHLQSYEEVPAHLAQKIIEGALKEKEALKV